ncbi:MAG: oxidoreductase, partial [Bacteroidia bacterium]|nr:oxidoreductase [Bacteroidia bacterium]
TGPQTDFENIYYELIKNLVSRKLIATDEIKYGLNTDLNGAIIDKSGKTLTDLFTLGPPMKGILWECVAIPEIKIQAEKLAALLVKN